MGVKLGGRDGALLRFDPAGTETLRILAQRFPDAAKKARRRAINKTLRWLRTNIARAISREERIALRAVRQRLLAYPPKGGVDVGRLWLGLNPLDASRAGRPRQTQTGVSVAGRTYRGAFYARAYGSNPDIWIRTGSLHFDPADYPESQVVSLRNTRRGTMDAHMYGRFPLAKARITLSSARPLFDQWARRAEARFAELAQHEVNYELRKLTGG